jgi:two-component system phosphate regulon sensor histidine kinase PhoR
MAEGVLVVDRAGRPLLANAAFRALFDLPAAAPAAALLDLAREPRLGDLVTAALASGSTRGIELERVVSSAAAAASVSRRLALVATPLSVGGGVVLVARDVTEAERLHQMRKEFVANVSHELKTPLAAIRGFAETLVDGALDEPATARRFSERILEQCRRLGDLLDDLLTLSRLEGTEALRKTERVDLREVAVEALELVRARAAAKPVTLELAPGAAVVDDGDADALLRLLSNLLDNAVKYNHPGGAVRVRLDEREGLASVEVEDSGIGIPAAQVDRIFERFYRVDTGRAREEGGTGLGLAIVKHVAQAHRGRVEVSSELGRGSVFRVFLPLVS